MPDKLGPIEIEFVLDKQADEQAKKLKASLDAVGTSAKTAIKEQQFLIKSMEEDIKRIQNLITSATPIAKNKGIFAELSRMKENLTAEQGKLDELRASLNEAAKAERDFNAAHKEAIAINNEINKQEKEEEVSKNKIVESLKKWGIGLFTVGAALKVAKDIINSTEGSADKFNETVGLLTGGIQGLYRTIITGQWDQLITNIVNAAKATRDLKEATSELEHITAGGTIKRAELLLKLEEAKTKAWEAMDPKEFTKFYDQAESYQKQITELNVGEIKKRLTIDEDYYFKLTGHSKEYYDYLLTQIPNIAKGYETFYRQQEGYQIRLNQLKYLASAQSGGLTKAQEKERHELQLTVFALEDYKILQEDLSKKGQWDEYIKGIGDMTQAAAAGQLSLVLLAKYKSMAAMKAMTADKAAIEDAKLLNQLAKQYELLDKAVDDGDTAAMKSIADKIVLLKEELDVRTKIAKAAILAAYGGAPPKAGIPSIPNLYTGTGITPGLQPASAEAQKGAALGKARQWNVDDLEYSEKKKKLTKEILQLTTSLVMQLGQQVGLSQEEMQLLGGTLDAFTKLATGDLPGAAISMLSGLMAMIPNEAEKFALQIEHINNLIAQQQRLIDQSERKGGKDTAVKDLMELYKQQKANADEQVRIAEINLKDKQGFMFGIGIGVNAAKKKLEEAKQAAIEAGNSIEDLQQEYDDFMRGGITENTIADSITQAFQDGKTSVDDLGNYANKVLSDAVLNIFKQKLLDDPAMKVWMKEATAAFNNPELTQEQKDKLKADYVAIGKKYEDWYNNMTSGFTDSATQNANSLSGAIKGITEETASVLAGQVNNIRISQAVSAGIMRQQLMHLSKIAANTDYCKYLKSIDEKIGTLKTNSLRAQGLQV